MASSGQQVSNVLRYLQIKKAVLDDDVEAFDRAYDQNTDLNILYGESQEARSLLHFAAAAGNDKIISKLIQLGANVNILSRSQHGGCTPLFEAASIADYWSMWILITNGADIKATGPGDETILGVVLKNTQVVEQRHNDILNFLFAQGVDVSYRASRTGPSIVSFLIFTSHDLSLSLSSSTTQSHSTTPNFSDFCWRKVLIGHTVYALRHAQAIHPQSASSLILGQPTETTFR